MRCLSRHSRFSRPASAAGACCALPRSANGRTAHIAHRPMRHPPTRRSASAVPATRPVLPAHMSSAGTNMSEATRFLVQEVHNFGGFFGGDTVTLTATPFSGAAGPTGEEQTITIDQQALANVRDRHTISAGMLLEVVRTGERVDRAALLGAATYAQ